MSSDIEKANDMIIDKIKKNLIMLVELSAVDPSVKVDAMKLLFKVIKQEKRDMILYGISYMGQQIK